MLRQNIFLGHYHAQHYIRHLLEGNDKVATPIMSYLGPAKTLVQPYSRLGMGNPVLLKIIFDNVNVQEGTYFVPQADGEMKKEILPNLPSGSRLWFFKHSNVQKQAEEHYEYLQPIKHDKYLMASLNFEKTELDMNQIKTILIERNNYLDLLANNHKASPWKTFNLSEFFEDGVDNPTEMMVRVKTIE